MSLEEEYAELEEIIIQKVDDPKYENPKLEEIEKDPKYYEQMQFLLENSDNPKVLNYCSNYLRIFVSQDSPIWTVPLLTEILEWIPAFLQKRIETIFHLSRSYRNVIIDSLTKLFTYIINQVSEANSKPSEIFSMIINAIPDSDVVHRELQYSFLTGVINEINTNSLTQKIRAQIVADRNDTTLIELFMQVVENNFSQEYDFSRAEQAGMVQTILELLLSILEMYNKKKKESQDADNDDFLCDLSVNFKDILKNEDFINTLFNFFNFSKSDQGNNEIIKLLFRIIFQIFSVKSTYFPNNADKISLIVPTLINLTQLMEIGISANKDAFHGMANVINRMAIFFDDKVVAEIEDPFSHFLNALKDVLGPFLNEPKDFIESNVAVVNIIKFWSIVASKNSSITQITEIAYPLFQSYVQILMKCSSDFADDIVDILDLDKYTICNSIQIIPNLLKHDYSILGSPLESAARSVFESYKDIVSEKKDSEEDQKLFHSCDIQMSIFVLIMTSGLRNIVSNTQFKYKKRQPDDFENAFFNFIMEVIEFTDANIQTIFAMNGMLLEQSIYVFARSFWRTIYGRFFDSEEEEDKEKVMSIYNRIIKRLIDALYGLYAFTDEHKYLFNNLLTIENMYNRIELLSKPKGKAISADGTAKREDDSTDYALELPATKELIESVANGGFQFIVNNECCLNFKKEISLLMKIVRSIVSKNREVIKPFLGSVEEKFISCSSGDQNAVATLVFIYELIGIFSNDVGVSEMEIETDTSISSSSKSVSTYEADMSKIPSKTTVNESFVDFFNWAFPDKLEMLSKIAGQVAQDPYIAAAYLKFWYIFMAQVTAQTKQSLTKKGDQIFPRHSANSIILFTYVANVLSAYFQAIAGTDIEKVAIAEKVFYKEKLKPMKNALLLMSESLGADYIMFGAFELYGDQTLSNLLSSFVGTIEGYSLDIIFLYPKLAISFMKVINSLCKNHLMLIVECSQPFFDYLFRVITLGLSQIDKDLVNISIESGLNLGNFLQSNKAISQVIAELIGRNQSNISQIVTIGFSLYLQNSEIVVVNQYELLKMIGSFLTIVPDILTPLAENMSSQVPEENGSEYAEIFQEMISTVSEIFVFERFKPIMASLKNFATNHHLKVPMSQ